MSVLILSYILNGAYGDELPRDCSGIYNAGERTSGVHTICLGSGTGDEERVDVYCNFDVGDGWTVIQRRHDGSVDFYRDWASYKNGFGDIENEFWLGNDIIHRITYQATYRLRIEMVDLQGNQSSAVYDNFRVANEGDQYRLGGLTFVGGSEEIRSIRELSQQLSRRYLNVENVLSSPHDKAAFVQNRSLKTAVSS
ncbi:ficolin-1-like [Lytechinus variegatus]|uniref:ficolin-1-like n=1 Tax=Lytechinus variegatus TaxID=7654 RepID=UPI001BB17B28|nr:ficolin-1-like [Lytechinus variegatus]